MDTQHTNQDQQDGYEEGPFRLGLTFIECRHRYATTRTERTENVFKTGAEKCSETCTCPLEQ